MSLTATAHSIPGSLRQDIVIDGRHHLTTDEPVAVGGEGSAPAPHELLVAALAGWTRRCRSGRRVVSTISEGGSGEHCPMR